SAARPRCARRGSSGSKARITSCKTATSSTSGSTSDVSPRALPCRVGTGGRGGGMRSVVQEGAARRPGPDRIAAASRARGAAGRHGVVGVLLRAALGARRAVRVDGADGGSVLADSVVVATPRQGAATGDEARLAARRAGGTAHDGTLAVRGQAV